MSDSPGTTWSASDQPAGEPVLVTIGDISVTQSVVYTPSGSRPLNEVSWNFTDMSVTTQEIPTWAIICAIIFFVLCLIGLLFLLVKETTTKGYVQVTVQGPGFLHTSQIPVVNMQQIADINARVQYARTVTATHQGLPQPGSGIQTPIGWPGQPGQGYQPGQPVQDYQQPGQPVQDNQQPGQRWQQPGQPG